MWHNGGRRTGSSSMVLVLLGVLLFLAWVMCIIISFCVAIGLRGMAVKCGIVDGMLRVNG